jgi:iron(III) transport system substrate-binding protein
MLRLVFFGLFYLATFVLAAWPHTAAAATVDEVVKSLRSLSGARKEKGAPIDYRMLDPYPGEPNGLALMSRAAHPHAAILFIDWMLSKKDKPFWRSRCRA